MKSFEFVPCHTVLRVVRWDGERGTVWYLVAHPAGDEDTWEVIGTYHGESDARTALAAYETKAQEHIDELEKFHHGKSYLVDGSLLIALVNLKYRLYSGKSMDSDVMRDWAKILHAQLNEVSQFPV